MIPRDVKSPTVAIPFHRLLKIVAIVDDKDPQTKKLLDCIEAENFEVEVTDSLKRDVAEDTSVGAYIALIDGDRLKAARQLALAVRAIGFRTPLWALADSHKLSDMAVLDLTGQVDGYIYLGQQTPAFYAKQVIASLLMYGKTLLPPFFGGLMAYDGEANIAFDCPGHQGGQFYRKSPSGQLFFKHFGETIFRNDLCNADVDLGDLLIHEGPAVEAQKFAAKVFGADKTYFVLNGTSTSNKIVTNALLKRGDLVLFDRNNHKSLHQGALVQAGATPIFLPTARNAFGMIGAVDWDAWDEGYLQGADTHQSAGEGCEEAVRDGAAVPAGVHPARHLRRHGLQRPQGPREDRPPLRLRALGRGLDRLQRVPSALRGPQPDAAG